MRVLGIRAFIVRIGFWGSFYKGPLNGSIRVRKKGLGYRGLNN